MNNPIRGPEREFIVFLAVVVLLYLALIVVLLVAGAVYADGDPDWEDVDHHGYPNVDVRYDCDLGLWTATSPLDADVVLSIDYGPAEGDPETDLEVDLPAGETVTWEGDNGEVWVMVGPEGYTDHDRKRDCSGTSTEPEVVATVEVEFPEEDGLTEDGVDVEPEVEVFEVVDGVLGDEVEVLVEDDLLVFRETGDTPSEVVVFVDGEYVETVSLEDEEVSEETLAQP